MSEVGSGQVAIFPTFKGFRSKVNAEADGAGRAGGKAFSSAFSSGAGDPADGLVKKLNAQIASGSKALSSARLAEQDAAGRVRVAEAALAEARAKGSAESSRAVAAEERLAAAQRKLADAQAKTKASSDQLRDSQARLADATSEAGESGSRAAGRFASGWQSLRGRLSSSARGAVSEAGSAAESEANEAGSRSGKGFVSGFRGLVGAGLALAGAGMFGGFIAEAAKASDATDKFKATMSFAGLDTSAIDTAAKAAKDYADQTVFDLPTIQTTIAQLASNGVKDYTGLTKAAGNLNAVAGGNAETFKSVATVMTQTAGAGKLTTENWNQLSDAIPGAAGPLTRSLQEAGAFTGNFREAMEKGEITADEFNAALMKLGNDPVAVEAAKSTKTFEGALGGLTATINSGLTGALNALKPTITGAINGLTGGLTATFDYLGTALPALKSLIVDGDFTGAFTQAFGAEEDSPVVGWILGVRESIVAGLTGISEFISGFTMPLNLAEQFAGEFSLMQSLGLTARAWADGIGGFARQLYDTLAPAISGLLPQIISLWTAFSPLQIIFQAIQPLLPQIAGLFGQVATTLGGTLSTVLTTVVPLFMQLSGVISQALGTVLATVLPVAVQMMGMLGDTFAQLMPVILPIITTIITLATTLISQLVPIITELVASVLPPVVSIFGNVLSAIGPLISMIAGLLIPIIEALMPVVVTVFGVIADVITSVMQIVQGIIQVVTGIISGNWSQVWEGIGNIFSGIWNTIVSVVTGVLSTIGQVIMAGLNFVFRFVGDVLGNIGRFFSETWDNITRGVSGFIDGFLGFFRDLPGKVMGFLSNAGSWLLNVGKDIIDGLVKGIQNMAGTVAKAILNLIPEAIRGPIEQALGIRSPSRVAMWWMEMIGAGFVKQAPAEQARISRVMDSLVTAPSSVSADLLRGQSDAAASAQRIQHNKITINQVDDPIGTSHAVVRRLQALAV